MLVKHLVVGLVSDPGTLVSDSMGRQGCTLGGMLLAD